MAVKHTSSLAQESCQAVAKLLHFPIDTIFFAEKKYKLLPTGEVENENKEFGIDLTWLEGKKFGTCCFLPGQKCKGSCVANEHLNFSKILVRMSKIWQITPPMELTHRVFYGQKTRLLTDLKVQLVGRYHWTATFLSQRVFFLIQFFLLLYAIVTYLGDIKIHGVVTKR